MKSITIICLCLFIYFNVNGQYIPQNQKIVSEGEIELSGTNARIIFKDLTSNYENNYYAFHENGNFYITWYNVTTNKNFRLSGANLYLGEGFNSGGTRLSVGNSGDGSRALANSWSVYSDKSLKRNMRTLGNCLTTINRLNPVSYTWKRSKYEDFGFIAQEVEKVLPEIVNTEEETNLKSLDYTRIIPFLVGAMQEQQTMIKLQEEKINHRDEKIEQLSVEVAELKTMLETLIADQKTKNAQSAIIQSAKLGQNSPNPFENNTKIPYTIPTNAQSANMLVHNINGQLIHAIAIRQFGEGILELQTTNLSNGQYTYSLEVDGRIIATKQMSLQR